MVKSPWAPIIASFLVIVLSSFFINQHSSPSLPISGTLQASPTPSPSPSPSAPVAVDSDYFKSVYAKCGETPYLPEYSSTRFNGQFSQRLWSPGCRFVAWSATIKNSFGSWQVSPYEGLFLYDLKTKKVTQLYSPSSQSNSVHLLKWLDDDRLIFHRDVNNSDYVYNMSTKSYSLL